MPKNDSVTFKGDGITATRVSEADRPKPCPSEADQVPTVYLTTQQLQRLAALALDAQSGIQLHTDANAESYVYGEYVPADTRGSDLEFFTIDPDGEYHSTT